MPLRLSGVELEKMIVSGFEVEKFRIGSTTVFEAFEYTHIIYPGQSGDWRGYHPTRDGGIGSVSPSTVSGRNIIYIETSVSYSYAFFRVGQLSNPSGRTSSLYIELENGEIIHEIYDRNITNTTFVNLLKAGNPFKVRIYDVVD